MNSLIVRYADKSWCRHEMDHRTCCSCRACPFHHVRARSGSRSICLRRQCDGQRAGFRKRLILRESTRRKPAAFHRSRKVRRPEHRAEPQPLLRCFCRLGANSTTIGSFSGASTPSAGVTSIGANANATGAAAGTYSTAIGAGADPNAGNQVISSGAPTARCHWRWRWRWSDSSEIDGKPERCNRWKHGCAQQRQHCRGSRNPSPAQAAVHSAAEIR